jgi:hypothetical protein
MIPRDPRRHIAAADTKLAAGAPQTWLTDIRARSTVGDVIAAIAGFLARRQKARPMAGCGSERTVVGRTPSAIVVQVPAVSIGRMEGAGTTLAEIQRLPPGAALERAMLDYACLRKQARACVGTPAPK